MWQKIIISSCKDRKRQSRIFGKKILVWRYSQKGLQISPKSGILITALTIFLVFGLKLVLNVIFNLNETYFSEKSAIWRYLTLKSSKKLPKLRFLAIFMALHREFFLILYIMVGGHDV